MGDAMDLPPPHEIDRRIARAALDLRKAERALREADGERVNVLEAHRAVSTRSAWIELGERAGDPLLGAARAWTTVLTMERVVWPARVRVADAWHEESIVVNDPEPVKVSPRALRDRLLAEVEGPMRRRWADALAAGAGPLADTRRVTDERRAEAARRLGSDGPQVLDAIEIPLEKPEAITRVAEAVLDRTREMIERGAGGWADALDRLFARRAGEGWPARLSVRWFDELFRRTGLLDGLAPDVGRLPRALGSSSFARALALFGAAWAEADVPRAAPFVLVHPPFDLRRARRAALFGALPADPVFSVRALGLGRDRARAQAREIAEALLLSLRLDAARVLMRGSVALSMRAQQERFEELTDRAFGTPIPGRLIGVLPSLDPGDPVRLLGALLAASDRRALVERFDDDWFKSPHAAEALRHEQALLPPPRVAVTAVEAGLDDLVRALAELFR
jgi:hypothetical protein